MHVTDSSSKQELGKIVVDKQCWVLGGMAASTQTAESFMDGAAKKIAGELADAKNNHGDLNLSAQPKDKK